MTYQPGEQPYTQPQDPWSGTQGIASAPTDPLPQPVRAPGQFAPGVASPPAWTPQNVAPSDPYVPPRQGGGRAGLYVLVVLLVIVLGGAGGFGSWWAITKYASGIINPPTTTTTDQGPESPTPEPTEQKYAPQLVEVGDCLENRNPNPDGNPPDMWIVPCERENTYEVLKIVVGEQIPEDEKDEFTEDTAKAMCQDVTWNSWFGWNSPSNSQDHFYCMWTDVTAS